MTSSKKLRIFTSTTHDPFFNLATENWIFRDLDPEEKVLFLWRNEDTVVIGRFQNPWNECHVQKMNDDGVHLARRQSGGGAVFHDLGNTNFTLMSSKIEFDKSINNKIITDALASFDIKAYASGRNDIVVDDHEGPKKISGSAFKQTKDRSFHHGTLLINANLGRLADYLNPSPKKLQSKGVASVRARVANLIQYNPAINHQNLCQKIITSFQNHYQCSAEIELLDVDKLKNIPSLQRYYEELKDWNWRFGETPQFTHHLESRLSWGGVDLHFDCHKGKIEKARIFSDSLHPEMIEAMAPAFTGKNYDQGGIEAAIQTMLLDLPMLENELQELKAWLKQEIQ